MFHEVSRKKDTDKYHVKQKKMQKEARVSRRNHNRSIKDELTETWIETCTDKNTCREMVGKIRYAGKPHVVRLSKEIQALTSLSPVETNYNSKVKKHFDRIEKFVAINGPRHHRLECDLEFV